MGTTAAVKPGATSFPAPQIRRFLEEEGGESRRTSQESAVDMHAEEEALSWRKSAEGKAESTDHDLRPWESRPEDFDEEVLWSLPPDRLSRRRKQGKSRKALR